jgi:hypothetical protein
MSEQAPESYLNAKRPPLIEALALEGGTFEEAVASLRRKGYFKPPPRPWHLGIKERGMGRQSFAVLDSFNDVIVETGDNQTLADFIIVAANAYNPPPETPQEPR